MGARPIVLIVNKFLYYSGGVEHVIDRYSDVLRAMGYRTVVVGQQLQPGEKAARFVEAADRVCPVDSVDAAGGGAEVLRFASRAILGSEPRLVVRTLVEGGDVALAIVFNAYHQLGFSMLAPLREHGIPTVLSLHDYKPGCTNYRFFDERAQAMCQDCTVNRLAYLYRPIANACVKGSRAGSAVLVAESLSQRLRRTYSRGFSSAVVLNSMQRDVMLAAGMPASQIRLIPNAVNPRDVNWAEDVDGAVLYVGRLSVEKGVEALITAATAARVPLRVVGDGPFRQRLEDHARALDSDVQFLGWLDPPDVDREMAAARLLAVPSEWPEVFPLVVCEAMTIGLPVVATEVGGHVDLLGDSRGILVPPGDTVALRLALETKRMDLISISARARAFANEALSPERWANAMQEFLAEVAGVRPI